MEEEKKFFMPQELEKQMKLRKILPMDARESLALLTGIVNNCLLSLPGFINPDHPDENMRIAYIGMNSPMLILWQKIGGKFVEEAQKSGWKASVEDINEEYFLILKPLAPSDDERRAWILETLNGLGHSMIPWDQDGETTHFTMCRYCQMFVEYRDRLGASYRRERRSVRELSSCLGDD